MHKLEVQELEALKSFNFESKFEKESAEMLNHVRKGLEKKLIDIIEGEITEDIMDILLKLMGIILFLDKDYRKNIKDFNAVYVFRDKNNSFYTAAIFKHNKLEVSNKKQKNPTFTLTFKDNQALVKLMFSGSADILDALLNQEVDFKGNINYMNKFGYMVLHLVNSITGGMHFAKEAVSI